VSVNEVPQDGLWNSGWDDSQLRLHTMVRLRWLAVFGQLAAIAVVAYVLGFDMPVGWCLFVIALSAWLNVYLSVRYLARHRLSGRAATALLAYDIAQLGTLLYLTGGIENPFTMLLIVPVTVSAGTLPPLNTIVLGLLTTATAALLAFYSFPLPWFGGRTIDHHWLYDVGMFSAVLASMVFIALYVRRLTRESKLMSAALAATELVLAREQKLQALDGLAAAAAHELGTPLSTIVLVTKEIQSTLAPDNPLSEDVELLRQQALRCREILQKLTREPTEQDPLHASMSLQAMLAEAAEPYGHGVKPIHIFVRPAGGAQQQGLIEPMTVRNPGVLYGLGNILENAVDFAKSRVDLTAEWDGQRVELTVCDDGPGFKSEVIDTIGEPYVTTRSSGGRRPGSKAGGLGLGFFIAKTLLERSGAKLTIENRAEPQTGALVRLTWPRSVFEARPFDASAERALPKTRPAQSQVEAFDR
jgi:two-component system, sensor histidine kinase RegB